MDTHRDRAAFPSWMQLSSQEAFAKFEVKSSAKIAKTRARRVDVRGIFVVIRICIFGFR